MHVQRDIIDGLPWYEFEGWQAFYSMEPWGEDRNDFRSAIIAKTLSDLHRKKGHSGYPLHRFIAPISEGQRSSGGPIKPITTKEQFHSSFLARIPGTKQWRAEQTSSPSD